VARLVEQRQRQRSSLGRHQAAQHELGLADLRLVLEHGRQHLLVLRGLGQLGQVVHLVAVNVEHLDHELLLLGEAVLQHEPLPPVWVSRFIDGF